MAHYCHKIVVILFVDSITFALEVNYRMEVMMWKIFRQLSEAHKRRRHERRFGTGNYFMGTSIKYNEGVPWIIREDEKVAEEWKQVIYVHSEVIEEWDQLTKQCLEKKYLLNDVLISLALLFPLVFVIPTVLAYKGLHPTLVGFNVLIMILLYVLMASYVLNLVATQSNLHEVANFERRRELIDSQYHEHVDRIGTTSTRHWTIDYVLVPYGVTRL